MVIPIGQANSPNPPIYSNKGMTEPNSQLHSISAHPQQMPEPFLRMTHVNVALSERIVLHDINLTIQAGEHVAILGPNGCGKSTLIRTMNCELYPVIPPAGAFTHSGELAAGTPRPEISIFGRSRWDLTQLRQHFGVVSESLPAGRSSEFGSVRTAKGLEAVVAGFFSASSLWPNLTVTEEMRDRAAEALERVDATRLTHQFVSEMSAGERRRILIARALVHRPRQLLLDEPSNALDLAAQRGLRETMVSLIAEGIGLVLVTHHLGDIPPQIDRVILMNQGKILEDGTRADLLTAPKLSRLFNTEVSLGQEDGWLYSW